MTMTLHALALAALDQQRAEFPNQPKMTEHDFEVWDADDNIVDEELTLDEAEALMAATPGLRLMLELQDEEHGGDYLDCLTGERYELEESDDE